MPSKVDYPAFVFAALQVFANSANDLYHTSGVHVTIVRTGSIITLSVNRKPVCQIKVEGM